MYHLKNARNIISNRYIALFNEMIVLFQSDDNMFTLRKMQRESHPPMIPYSCILFKDLIAIEEGFNKRNNDATVNFYR